MIASNPGWIKRNAPPLQTFCILALLSMLIPAPAFLMTRLLEPGLILPALSILLFSHAAIAAIVAVSIHADRNSKNITLWDIAGAFALTGCAAAIFGEPHQVTVLFEQASGQRRTAPARAKPRHVRHRWVGLFRDARPLYG